MNYYNENDPAAAAWLRELIRQGHLPQGEVDERSITEVEPGDLRGFVQCHFFAGIGGWSLALRLAGWPIERPVWTGSCPCQPFSAAGKRGGTDDKRHLWPEFYRLIAESQPATVFGEQVASRLGREWLAGVFADLEAVGYAVAGADLCAASVGAPHIRQRLYWAAWMEYAKGHGRDERRTESGGRSAASGCSNGGVADANRERHAGQHALLRAEAARRDEGALHQAAGSSEGGGGVGDADDAGSQGRGILPERAGQLSPWEASLDNWIPCADGKARRIEPGLEPLAHGVPARVGRLRGYGNAIVPQVAATFIRGYRESLELENLLA